MVAALAAAFSGLATAAAFAQAVPVPTIAPSPAPAATSPAAAQFAPCRTAYAKTLAVIDTTNARVGDVFRFATIAPPDGSTPGLPAGLTGYGIVTHADHAKRGRGGRLAIDARYVANADGSHVAATLLDAQAYVEGDARDLPVVADALGLFRPVPFEVLSGLAIGYDLIHQGGQSRVPAGATLRLLVGDDYLTGSCQVPRV